MHYHTRKTLLDALGNMGAFVYNLLYFAKRSQTDNDLATLRNFVLSLPREVKEKYAEECAYVETMSIDALSSIMFPYPEVKRNRDASKVVADVEGGLPYVIHREEKKLFFPRHCSTGSAISQYLGLVNDEGLLGTGSRVKSPHCYQDENFKVEDGDILLDIGCAEAIFALDNIGKVSRAYLFECASEWRKPLRRSFAPYGDKVVLVNKLVSDNSRGKTTTLLDAVKGNVSVTSHFFVKMDIEGGERTVLKGNVDFFMNHKVKLSCCVYHRQDDAQVIETTLRDMGYKTRFSEGYMLPVMNGIHYPYFRHGVIYAQNY